MRQAGIVMLVVAAAMGAVSAAYAESASVMLEKGIHLEETVGDLDGAIEVYGKIVADAKANRRHVAEAQLRLGLCLEKKGKKAEAMAAFQKLIAEYADQTELVRQARAHLPKAPGRKDFLPVGKVVERTVNDDGADTDFVIDLDTGKLLTPPSKDAFADDKALMSWVKQNGVDAMGETKPSIRGLAGFEMIAIPIGNQRWGDLKLDEFLRLLGPGEPGTPAIMSGKGELPATFLIKTREGGMGMLQIVGFARPKGIQIRYKMLGYDETAYTGLPLGPVPWQDGEVLQLEMKLQTGMDIGAFVCTADSAKVDGRDVWQFRIRRYVLGGQSQGASRADVDKKTFRPIRSVFNHEILGDVEAIYGPGQVETITRIKGKEDKKKTTDLDGVFYDNEEGIHLFRRLPLAVGYKVEVPIFAGFGAGKLPVELEVPAKEKLQVPAGEFECYRVELDIGQTFWVSTDAKRYLVKFEGAGALAELAEIRHRKPGEPSKFVDKGSGISLTAPHGWFFHKEQRDKDKTTVHILDPEGEAFSQLEVKPLDKLGDDEKKSLRAWAAKDAEGVAEVLKDFKIRDDSWKELKVAGLPAVSCVADYVQGKKKKMSYGVYSFGQTTAANFSMMGERDGSDDLRKAFDGIIASYKQAKPK